MKITDQNKQKVHQWMMMSFLTLVGNTIEEQQEHDNNAILEDDYSNEISSLFQRRIASMTKKEFEDEYVELVDELIKNNCHGSSGGVSAYEIIKNLINV